MKLSLVLLAASALFSISASAQTFAYSDRGAIQNVQPHARENALGNCIWAQYLSCTIISDTGAYYNEATGSYEDDVVVEGQNLDRDPATNRILKGTAEGNCGEVVVVAEQNALDRCVAAGIAGCHILQDVTVSDNGADYCVEYALAK